MASEEDFAFVEGKHKSKAQDKGFLARILEVSLTSKV